jgi:hypothetical protein
MATFEVPDDLAKFLAKWAPRQRKTDAHALLVFILEQYRKSKEHLPGEPDGREPRGGEKEKGNRWARNLTVWRPDTG